MPKGRLSPLAKTSFVATLPASPRRSTRMRPGPVSATKMSPFGATRSTRASRQAVSQQLDLESLRHERRALPRAVTRVAVRDRRRGAGLGQILRADQPDGAGLVGLPAAIGVLALQHGLGLRTGAGNQPAISRDTIMCETAESSRRIFLPRQSNLPNPTSAHARTMCIGCDPSYWKTARIGATHCKGRRPVAVIKAAASTSRLMG